MTELEYEAKLAELDRLINDPEIRMDPDRVWSLLAELSAYEARMMDAPALRLAGARPPMVAEAAAPAASLSGWR